MENEIEVMSKAEQVELEFLRLYDEFQVADAPERKKADIIDSFWEDIYKLVFKPRPGERFFNNTKSRLKTYDVEEVEEVCNKYITLCRRYGGVIKITEFANLTGIHRSTFNIWHERNKNGNGYIVNLNSKDIAEENRSIIYIYNNNDVDIVYNGNGKYVSGDNTKGLSSLRFDVTKKLQEAINSSNTNGLSQDTTGFIVQANNDPDALKNYARTQLEDRMNIMRRELVAEDIRAMLTARSGQNEPKQLETQDIVVDDR